MKHRLVLVGAGFPHLLVLESMAAGRLHLPGAVLVSASPTEIHSGMVPGLIGGHYAREEVELDLAALARAAGAELVGAAPQQIDAPGRAIVLEGGQRLPFQVASFALGSDPPGCDLPGVHDHALFLKPAHRATVISAALERAALEMGPEPVRVVIVGGGASGVATALAARNRLDRSGATRAVVTLVETGHQVMGDYQPAMIREARQALGRAEITLRLGMTAVEAGPRHVGLANGAVLPADLIIWTTGTSAPAIFRESGLPVDGEGRLLVEDTLRVVGAPAIFASGDSATLRSHGGPRSPLIDVTRAGTTLGYNLQAALNDGAELAGSGGSRGSSTGSVYRVFRPRSRIPALIDIGAGQAILAYGRVALTSRWAMWLKDRSDRSLVSRFRTLASSSSPKASAG